MTCRIGSTRLPADCCDCARDFDRILDHYREKIDLQQSWMNWVDEKHEAGLEVDIEEHIEYDDGDSWGSYEGHFTEIHEEIDNSIEKFIQCISKCAQKREKEPWEIFPTLKREWRDSIVRTN